MTKAQAIAFIMQKNAIGYTQAKFYVESVLGY